MCNARTRHCVVKNSVRGVLYSVGKNTHFVAALWFPVKYNSSTCSGICGIRTVIPPLFTVGNDLVAKLTPVVCTAASAVVYVHILMKPNIKVSKECSCVLVHANFTCQQNNNIA